MIDYKSEFIRYLKYIGVNYIPIDDRRVRVDCSGQNTDTISIYIMFSDDGSPFACFRCWDIMRAPEEKRDRYIRGCNELNNQYTWVKFYIDGDNDIMAAIDAYFDEKSCGEVCMFMLRRIVSIIDSSYPEIMEWRNS